MNCIDVFFTLLIWRCTPVRRPGERKGPERRMTTTRCPTNISGPFTGPFKPSPWSVSRSGQRGIFPTSFGLLTFRSSLWVHCTFNPIQVAVTSSPWSRPFNLLGIINQPETEWQFMWVPICFMCCTEYNHINCENIAVLWRCSLCWACSCSRRFSATPSRRFSRPPTPHANFASKWTSPSSTWKCVM